MRKFAALAAALLLYAGAAQADGYPNRGRAVDQLVPARDYGDVVQGRSRALGIMRARANGFVPSAAMHDYVRSVLARVLAGVNLPASFRPEVRILAAPEFTALCTPDGTIVVTVGLLELLDNEDELAFVLAHEASHAIYRHHASDWYTRSQYYMVVNGTALENFTGGFSFSFGGFDTRNINRGIDAAQHLYRLSENVLAPQMERGQEDAADALGFDLMVRAGYDPAQAFALMDKLAEQEAEAQASADAAKAADRKSADKNRNRSGGGGFSLGGFGHDNSSGNNRGSIFDLALGAFDNAVDSMADQATSHHPAREREELLSAYQFREYRELTPGNPRPLPWSEGSNAPQGPELTALLAHYAAAENAAAFIADANAGSPETAGEEVQHAAAEPTADHAYTQFVAAEFYEQSKRNDLSEAALQRAVKGPEPSWVVYSHLIDIYIARKDYTGAQNLMNEALGRFDNSPVLLPKRIAILRGLGQQREAEKLLPQCNAYDIHELYDACKKAAGRG